MSTRKMKVVPAGDRIMVLPDKPDERTESGLLVKPDIALEAPQTGEILAVGPGGWVDGADGQYRRPVAHSVGQRVLYGRYSGLALEGTGGLILIREGDVMAVLEPVEDSGDAEQSTDA